MNSLSNTTITIDRLVPGGQGIGTSPDGVKGFFWNALPGEVVTSYIITKKKSKYFEAIAKKIDKPSSYRTSPLDSCYLSTSPWQIMDYDYELAEKSKLLAEVFRQHNLGHLLNLAEHSANSSTTSSNIVKQSGNQNSSTFPVQTNGNDYHYRNKMEYSLYWDHQTESISLAFHQRGSHRKIPITSSSIERPEILAAAQETIAKLNAQHAEARTYQSLLLRANKDGKISGGLYENGKPHPIFDNLTDKILGQTYSYSPNGFFQINIPVYEMALEKIQQYINTDKVLDLYSGVGTIGLSVARDKDLTLVESNSAAFSELEKNCAAVANDQTPLQTLPASSNIEPSSKTALQISTPKAILSNSEDALDFISSDQTVILDPPRAGCHAKLLEKLLEVKPRTIIYLSCNPTTQVRDLETLTKLYHVVNITPYNFFPRTPHLENLVILNISPNE